MTNNKSETPQVRQILNKSLKTTPTLVQYCPKVNSVKLNRPLSKDPLNTIVEYLLNFIIVIS